MSQEDNKVAEKNKRFSFSTLSSEEQTKFLDALTHNTKNPEYDIGVMADWSSDEHAKVFDALEKYQPTNPRDEMEKNVKPKFKNRKEIAINSDTPPYLGGDGWWYYYISNFDKLYQWLAYYEFPNDFSESFSRAAAAKFKTPKELYFFVVADNGEKFVKVFDNEFHNDANHLERLKCLFLGINIKNMYDSATTKGKIISRQNPNDYNSKGDPFFFFFRRFVKR